MYAGFEGGCNGMVATLDLARLLSLCFVTHGVIDTPGVVLSFCPHALPPPPHTHTHARAQVIA